MSFTQPHSFYSLSCHVMLPYHDNCYCHICWLSYQYKHLVIAVLLVCMCGFEVICGRHWEYHESNMKHCNMSFRVFCLWMWSWLELEVSKHKKTVYVYISYALSSGVPMSFMLEFGMCSVDITPFFWLLHSHGIYSNWKEICSSYVSPRSQQSI